VQAGEYKAVLSKGKETFEQTFEVIYDENANLSSEDRELKHNTTMKLYNMSESLAYMVYELDAILESDKLKNKKLISELNSLKESLVVTTGDNYVGSAEPQLREKLADLFSKLASSYDRPSSNELGNLAILEERFDQANKDLGKLKKKVKIPDLNLKSFDDFINE